MVSIFIRGFGDIKSIIDLRPVIIFIAIEDPADQFGGRAGAAIAVGRVRGPGLRRSGRGPAAAVCESSPPPPWPRRDATADRATDRARLTAHLPLGRDAHHSVAAR